jgi:hypothetical protein
MLYQFWRGIEKPQRRKARKRAKARLSVEYLEDRCVPSISMWEGDASSSWNDPQNWFDGVPGVTPGVDAAEFNGNGNNPCTVDVNVSLKSITIATGFTETITLDQSLTLNQGGTSSMADGKLAGSGLFSIRDGTFNWSGGSWAQGPSLVGNSGVLNISGNVSLDCLVSNDGRIAISGGDLSVGQAGSISNSIDGTISIDSDNSILVPGGGTKLLSKGTLVKAAGSGTSTIEGGFFNEGTLEVRSGTLKFAGDTVGQRSGTTTLFGTTLATTNNAGWQMSAGSLNAGDGSTVQGKLDVTGGNVYPGGDGRLGTLFIEGDYRQTGGTLNIDIDLTNRDNDQVIVFASATLGGTLNVKTFPLPPAPATGTQYTIMTYINGSQGDFANSGLIPIPDPTKQYKTLPPQADTFYHLEVVGKPQVGALNPNAGPAEGGTIVTITGSGFTGATSVKFGGTEASFTVDTDTQITATSPGGSPDTVDVTVTNAIGTSDINSNDKFTYLTVVAYDDSYSVNQDQTLYVDASGGVLANDYDADNDTLTASVVTGPSNGFVTLGTDGSFVYTPSPGYYGADSFVYQADDGNGQTAQATVTIEVQHVLYPTTTTMVSTSPSPSTYGDQVTFTAQVSAVNPANGTPTGSVTFYVDGSPVGSGTLDNTGIATYQYAAMSAAIHEIMAAFNGDNLFAGSSSDTLSQTVNPAALTVTANDVSMTYGDGTTLNGSTGFSAVGFQNGDSIDSVTLSTNAPLSSSGNWTAGTWSITPSSATGSNFNPNNYTITYVNGTLTVNTAIVTVSGLAANDKVYDGTTAATVSTASASLSGVVSGDDVSLSVSGATFATANVGNGITVTIGLAALTGADNANYTLVAPGGLSANIFQAILTVTADDQSAPTGSTVPGLSYTVVGLVNGDSVSGALTSEVGNAGDTITAAPGTYAITSGNLTAGNNYTISFTAGTFTVTSA